MSCAFRHAPPDARRQPTRCFIVSLRLLGGGWLTGRRAPAFGLLVALLLGNAVWNAVFSRRRALDLSWWVALV